MKLAETAVFCESTRVQGPVPEQLPVQLEKVEPTAGDAVRVIVCPAGNVAEHPVDAAVPLVIVQLIPAGLETTLPLPFPAPETISEGSSNLAVTPPLCASVIVQVPVPVHRPLHPANVFPVTGEAVNVTTWPTGNPAEHPVDPETPFVMTQLTPTGVDETVPLPDPAPETMSTVELKPTDTVAACVTVIVQDPVPVHALPQPTKLKPDAGAAVRVTTVPAA